MIETLNEITSLLNWSGIAAIFAILSGVIVLILRITNTVGLRFESYLRANKHPIIEVPLIIDPNDKVEFFVQTFRPNSKSKENPFEYWEEDQKLIIEPEQNTYVIKKKYILNKLSKSTYPYKFFVRMDRSILDKYYARLASSGLIITGRGDEDSTNKNLWRIWFLISNEPQHPRIQDLFRINHKL